MRWLSRRGGILAIGGLREARHPLARPALVALSSFWALYLITIGWSHTIAFLPRYFVMVLPASLVIIMIERGDHWSSRLVVLLTLGYSLMNMYGQFNPIPNHANPLMAERSLAAQDYLEMQMANVRALAEADVELIVVPHDLLIRLKYPELGYIEEELVPRL